MARAERRPVVTAVTGLSAAGTAKGRLQRACLAILTRHWQTGELPTSARFVYYELKQDGYPLATHAVRRADQDVVDAISHLRKAGLVPWEWLADETRSVDEVYAAESVTAWLRGIVEQARIDPWSGQPAPLVLTESRGVRAALRATAARYAVPIASTNGQVGGFLHTDVAPLLAEGQAVAYVGDSNYAGDSIAANTRRVLERKVGGLDWHRLAVTPEQAQTEGMTAKPGTDRRHRDQAPHESYEAEALGQRYLADLLDGWLAGLLPEPLADVQERERAERVVLAERLAD